MGAAGLLAFVGYASIAYPNHRVLNWFELCTDGLAPEWLAADGQDVVGSHWKDASKHGFATEIADTVTAYLSEWGNGADVLEMAAGSGQAPAMWHNLFQEKGLCTRTILTDIQPKGHVVNSVGYSNNNKADNASCDCGSFNYISSPVDATQASKIVPSIVPDWGTSGKPEVRMIHLSLHHFDEVTVKKMLADAVKANAAILIADHAPNKGGVLYNGILAVKQLARHIPYYSVRNPIKLLLGPVMPIIAAGAWHDATVSILRCYSEEQLKSMLLQTKGGENYDIQFMKSPGYGEWIGLPSFLPLPHKEDSVMQFLFATPKTPSNGVKKGAAATYGVCENQEVNRALQAIQQGPEIKPVSAFMQWVVVVLAVAFVYTYYMEKTKKKKKKRSTDRDSHFIGKPAILAIGTAVPPYVWSAEDIMNGLEWKQKNMNLDPDFLDFMRRVHKTSGVETRFIGEPAEDWEKVRAGDRPKSMYGQDGNPTAGERHKYWAKWAPKLAIEAASKAIENWGGNKNDITHVVFHSCTGFKAPGIELDIIDSLKLSGVQRRLGINYMGCFGGFTGMAVAKAFCEADPGSIVLLVCAETCFAHYAFCNDRSKTIGNCFFSDGSSAALIGPGRPGDWAIGNQETKTLGVNTRCQMTWEPNDNCYDMFLDKGIGKSFGMHLYWNLKSYLRGICKESVKDIEWCVHPGGKGILDFFCSSKLNLGIDKSTLQYSYDILRTRGNMSSGTIFFVLNEMMNKQKAQPSDVKPTALCLGFGPGLTLEIAILHHIVSESTGETTERQQLVSSKTVENEGAVEIPPETGLEIGSETSIETSLETSSETSSEAS